jgi:two-component system LytT family sensor kinase
LREKDSKQEMKSKDLFKKIKLNFWHYQLIGFSIYTLNHVARYWELYSQSGRKCFSLLLGTITLVFLTLVMRKIYQYFYKLGKPPVYYILVISLLTPIFSLIWQEIRLIYDPWLWDVEETWFTFKRAHDYFFTILINAYVLFVWSILYFGIKYWWDLQKEVERSKALHVQAVEAQLKMLRYQLNPHFLFNSLNSIQGLMYQDVKKADLMLTELSEFLRFSLKFKNDLFITLANEFETVEKYLFIEKIRFNENLNYKITFPPEIANAKILCFLTQPLVENAIKHGMKSNSGKQTSIIVGAARSGDWLEIQISNTGKWLSNDYEIGTGIENLKERLQNAYEDKCSFNVLTDDDFVKIDIKIPYHE